MMTNPLETAIKLLGSQSALAAKLKIKPQAVQQWRYIPESRALEIEKITGGKIGARAVLEFAAQRAKSKS